MPEDAIEYTPIPGAYTYIIKITKHVAVKARNESEALRKAAGNEGSKIGRDAYALLGKIKNEDKETD